MDKFFDRWIIIRMFRSSKEGRIDQEVLKCIFIINLYAIVVLFSSFFFQEFFSREKQTMRQRRRLF